MKKCRLRNISFLSFFGLINISMISGTFYFASASPLVEDESDLLSGIEDNESDISPETDGCVRYINQTRTIYICNGSVNLTEINSIIRDPDILNNTSPKRWFLNANILLRGSDTILYINASDTEWLKINSTSPMGKISSSPTEAYSISVRGKSKLMIDDTKITSWNSTSNSVADLRNGTEPRAFLLITSSGGQMNITNSNLSHLGYVTFTRSGGDNGTTTGIAYYGGNGSLIKNNTISFDHRGFYSAKASNITIVNNKIYNSFEYGLDPHTGALGLRIINNTIYNNGAHGIICSQNCKNLLIEANKSYNNTGHGIVLDNGVFDSYVQNNNVYNNSYSGIGLWKSSNNTVKDNMLYNNTFGIIITLGSHSNVLAGNLIGNSSSYGAYFYSNASNNLFEYNNVLNSNSNGIYIQDADTYKNSFVQNKISKGLGHGIQLFNSSYNVFTNNSVSDNRGYNYYAKSNGTNNKIKDTLFDNTTLRFFDNSSDFIVINTDNTIIRADKRTPNIVHPRSAELFIAPISKNRILETLEMKVVPSSGVISISSLSKDFNNNSTNRKWVERSPNASVSTSYLLGGFPPNTQIMVKANGSFWNSYTSDSSGSIRFVYDGGKNLRKFEAGVNNMATVASVTLFVLIAVGIFIYLLIRRHVNKKINQRIKDYSNR